MRWGSWCCNEGFLQLGGSKHMGRGQTKLSKGPTGSKSVCLGVCLWEGVFHFPPNEVFSAVLLAWQYAPLLKLTKPTNKLTLAISSHTPSSSYVCGDVLSLSRHFPSIVHHLKSLCTQSWSTICKKQGCCMWQFKLHLFFRKTEVNIFANLRRSEFIHYH